MDFVEVIVATVGRPHGLRGEVAVQLRTDSPQQRFATGATVRVEGASETLEVAACRWQHGGLLVRFAGINDRSAAESLRGRVLVADVPGDESAGEGEYFDRQLIGLAVHTATGQEVGRVSSVQHLPAQDLLVVDTAGGERLVPFVCELVPEVDVDGGRLVVVDLPGLLRDQE